MREAMVIGEAGQRVARNVKRLRQQQRLSLVEVSRRLTEAGRPIARLGLSCIEKCERRVDLDDLVALANALNVPVDRLAFGDNLNVEVRVVLGSAERTDSVAD